MTPEEHPAPSPQQEAGGEPLETTPEEPPVEGSEPATGRRPGGDPEMHPDDDGTFGDGAVRSNCHTAALGAYATVRVQHCVLGDVDGKSAEDQDLFGDDSSRVDCTRRMSSGDSGGS